MASAIRVNSDCLRTLRHILAARIDHAWNSSTYVAWTSARDIIEYALANNYEALSQYDYLLTKEDVKDAN